MSLDALDRLFFAGGSLDGLYTDFVLDPIVEGRERDIDFVGAGKERLRVLRQWQRFVYGDGHTSTAQQVKVKLLSGANTAPRIFIGERMGQINLFGPNAVRPSTDAARVRILNMPLIMEDRPVRSSAATRTRAAAGPASSTCAAARSRSPTSSTWRATAGRARGGRSGRSTCSSPTTANRSSGWRGSSSSPSSAPFPRSSRGRPSMATKDEARSLVP